MSTSTKGILATTLAAKALVATASPAIARGYHRHHDNSAGVGIGAGIIGLATGAVVASNANYRYCASRYYDRGRYDESDRDWQRRRYEYDGHCYGRRGY